MKKDIRYVGVDVDSERLAVAVADADSTEVQGLGMVPHTQACVQALVRKLGPAG